MGFYSRDSVKMSIIRDKIVGSRFGKPSWKVIAFYWLCSWNWFDLNLCAADLHIYTYSRAENVGDKNQLLGVQTAIQKGFEQRAQTKNNVRIKEFDEKLFNLTQLREAIQSDLSSYSKQDQ